MSGQVSRGSAGEYQADEQAGMFTQVVFKGHRDWNQFFQSTTIPGNWPNIYFLLCDN